MGLIFTQLPFPDRLPHLFNYIISWADRKKIVACLNQSFSITIPCATTAGSNWLPACWSPPPSSRKDILWSLYRAMPNEPETLKELMKKHKWKNSVRCKRKSVTLKKRNVANASKSLTL